MIAVKTDSGWVLPTQLLLKTSSGYVSLSTLYIKTDSGWVLVDLSTWDGIIRQYVPTSESYLMPTLHLIAINGILQPNETLMLEII